MKKVKIYQIKDRGCKYFFRDYDETKFSFNDYKEVYSCERPNHYNLDSCWVEFNCHHPFDFTGHSLSTSDIVEINGVKYYCQDIGWERLN